MTRVLVVDDVEAMAEQYAYDLERVGGYETLIAAGGASALAALAADPIDCVILDLEMPGVDGFEVLRAMKERGLDTPVIVYTGTGNYDRCARAIRLGAYSFIDKAEPMERVVREVENALEQRRLIAEVDALKQQLGEGSGLVGSGAAMQELRDSIQRIAAIPSSVIILGESGAGKEVVARELHRQSPAAREPFVAINCAALPESLIESELFGHERGAFTGAVRTHKGAFEAAGKGTLLLDEIGELPLAAQAKLLRVIEERKVTRLGSNKTIEVAARIIATTNRDLEAEVEAGNFRQDLFFRLNVHLLRVPPLRERADDIPELVERLMKLICARYGMRPKRVGADAIELLKAYDWKKNNVRELRNVVERMIIAAAGDSITAEHIPAEIAGSDSAAAVALGGRGGGGGGGGKSFQELKSAAERRIILAALERNDWHITNTARELGLADHSSLLKIMRRHSLSRS